MKKIFLLFIIATFTFSLHAQSGKSKKESEPISPDPSFFIEKDFIDYGVIEKGAEGTKKFKVMNKGAQPLLLTSCTGSCGCTVPTCPREPILPGKSAEISIKYDTNRPGPINKQVSISTNDPKNPVRVVMVKGEVKEIAPQN
jgi:hypothetical protein